MRRVTRPLADAVAALNDIADGDGDLTQRLKVQSKDEVGQLARRLEADYGHVDILVNDIWGAELLKGPPSTWNTPVWEHDLDVGLRIDTDIGLFEIAISDPVVVGQRVVDRLDPLLVFRTFGRAVRAAARLVRLQPPLGSERGEEGIDFGWRQVFGGDPRDPAKRVPQRRLRGP